MGNVHGEELYSYKTTVRSWDLPEVREAAAKAGGNQDKVCFITNGGLGDEICSEPAVRYTVEVLAKELKLSSVSIAAITPALFQHIEGLEILQGEKRPNNQSTFTLGTPGARHFLYLGPWEFKDLQNSFFTHNTMHCIDYPALSSIRMQLPFNYRTPKTTFGESPLPPGQVVIHAGAHWKSKTFPRSWWRGVIDGLISGGVTPVLIGGKPGAENGTVNLDNTGCIDLREKLTFAQSATLLRDAQALITNDSFPMHLASCGQAHILFMATAKMADYITPFRNGMYGWRAKNFALGGTHERAAFVARDWRKLSDAKKEEVLSWLPSAKELPEYFFNTVLQER